MPLLMLHYLLIDKKVCGYLQVLILQQSLTVVFPVRLGGIQTETSLDEIITFSDDKRFQHLYKLLCSF